MTADRPTPLRYLVWAVLLALLAWRVWSPDASSPAVADTAGPNYPGDADLVLPGRVVRVIDGDTAVVELDSGEIKVRFHGVDAPEKKQPFGREATAFMRDLIGGQDVELVPVEQDAYDRLVAVVLVDGESANEALLREGYGWAYRDYLGQLPEDATYCRLEADARSARLGLWSQPTQRWVPPWIYRKRAKLPPGTRLPSPDYTRETAADCEAAMAQSRESRRSEVPAPLFEKPDDKSPGGCLIKGNINSRGERIYHVPGSPNYDSTRIDTAKGERWFCSEAEAKAAGWRAPR